MEFVTGALSNVIPKLRELITEEYNLQKGVRRKISYLSNELQIMHAALSEVAKVPSDQLDNEVKLWARDVRELSYDIEDILDTFLVAADCPDPAGLNRFKLLLGSMLINLFGIKNKRNRTHLQIADGNIHQIDTAIKEFEHLVQEVAERRLRYRLDVLGRPPTDTVDPRLPALYRNERDLVGIDEARDELVTMLALGAEQRIKVVSILGPGGVGKTTLAKAVYNRILLEEQFDCTAFVQVSQNADMKKVFEALLLECDEEKYGRSTKLMLDVDKLIKEIREFLYGKRYLHTRTLHHAKPVVVKSFY